MVINTDKTLNGKVLGYEVISNGYKLFQDGIAFISQPEPFSNLFVANGSYEENALAQIDSIAEGEKNQSTLQEQIDELYSFSADLLEQICLNELGIDESEVI